MLGFLICTLYIFSNNLSLKKNNEPKTCYFIWSKPPILHGRISLKKANMELSIQNPDKWKKRLRGTLLLWCLCGGCSTIHWFLPHWMVTGPFSACSVTFPKRKNKNLKVEIPWWSCRRRRFRTWIYYGKGSVYMKSVSACLMLYF